MEFMECSEGSEACSKKTDSIKDGADSQNRIHRRKKTDTTDGSTEPYEDDDNECIIEDNESNLDSLEMVQKNYLEEEASNLSVISETVTDKSVLTRGTIEFINVKNHPVLKFSEFSEFHETEFENAQANDVLISINNQRFNTFYEALGKIYHGPYPMTLQFARDMDLNQVTQEPEENCFFIQEEYEENMTEIFQKMDRDNMNSISIEEVRFLCNANVRQSLILEGLGGSSSNKKRKSLGLKDLKVILNTPELAETALEKLNNPDYNHEWKSVARQMQRRQIKFSEKQKACLTYKTFLLILFIVISILATLERFYINYMPDGQLPDIPFWESKFKLSFQLFHIVERITARIILVCLSLFFFTMTRVTHNFVCEIVPFTWFDMRNYNRDTFMFHKQVGLYIIIFMIVTHVGFAFVPIFDREFNLTTEPLYPFFIPFRRETPFPVGGKWNMRKDDLYQGAIGIVLAIFMPLTIIYKPCRKKYNISFLCHIVGAFVMIWLVYRIPEHVRTFAFLTAPVLHWLIDRIIFMFVYRRRWANVRIVRLDHDYMIACFPTSNISSEIGDQYFYSCSEIFGFRNFAHPYSAFILDLPDTKEGFDTRYDISRTSKRSSIGGTEKFNGSLLNIKPTNSIKGIRELTVHDEAGNIHGNVDIMFERTAAQKKDLSSKTKSQEYVLDSNKYVCSMVRIWGSKGFSSWLQTNPEESIQIRGPYRRVYSRLMQQDSICQPLVLMATGAGVGYILDFVRWIQENNIELLDRVFILYSVRSLAALTWVTDQLGASNKTFLEINLHITSTDFEGVNVEADADLASEINVLLGRLDLVGILDELSNITEVYFCGVKAIHDIVQNICNERKLQFFSEVPYD